VLIIDNTLIPLELGELRHRGGETYSRRLGRAALEEAGKKAWRKRVLKLVPSLQRAFLADYVVLGGGNAKLLKEPLPPGVRLGHNLTAFRGGYRLWGIDEAPTQVNGEETRAIAQGDWRLL
jgi:polyphosphate glucokinase